MPPTRTEKQPVASTSLDTDAKSVKHRPKQHRPRKPSTEKEGNAIPGLQKIKSALRQTRRLLSKDKLAADVRVETERRLKALEKDLAEAERVKKEKSLASRYHKVKFFERQKVTRKLSQVKRQLEASTDKKERAKLEKQLFALRVDLNYILHYPKLNKYISLFPPDVRQQDDKEKETDEGKNEDQKLTDQQREQIRQQIRECMKKGGLSMEPELENHDARASRLGAASRRRENDKEITPHSKGGQGLQKAERDEFFGNDSDTEGGESEGVEGDIVMEDS